MLKCVKEDLNYRCSRCQGNARLIDRRPQKGVQVGSDRQEVVASFWYMLFAAVGCELATTRRVKTAWKKFKELLPVLSSSHLSSNPLGCVYSSCVQNAMLHASETWPLTSPDHQHLWRNDRAMIREICKWPENVATVRSNELLTQLEINDLGIILRGKGCVGLDMLDDPGEQLRQFATCR